MLWRLLFPALIVVSLLAAGCITPALTDDLDAASVDARGFSDTAVFPGEYVVEGDFARVLTDGLYGLLPQELVTMQSAYDGAHIELGVLRPDVPEGEKVPVIAFASPYLMPLSTVDYEQRLARLVENFVPHGYAVALVPVRGTANMGSCMDLMGNAERADLDQAITWLGTQEWSNGNVGMVGVSYDGSTPWEVAAMGNPHLKTIVPISGVNDIYHLMFRNGTNELRGPGVLNALYYQYGFAQYNPTNGRDVDHTVYGVVCPESLKGFYAAIHSGLTGERDAAGFWAERNSRPGVEANYQGSIFHVQGLQDWNVDPAHNIPWVLELEQQGLVVKHLYGQWAHAWPDSRPEGNPNARWDWAEMLLRWFDRELKGLDVDVGPAVQVQSSDGKWRNEGQWPPVDAVERTFWLAPTGLADEPADASATMPLAPACGGLVPTDCVTFSTDVFESDFRFAGMPQLDLTVTPLGPGGHFVGVLYAQTGNTYERLGWGQVDLRFAAGGESMGVVVPGRPMAAGLEIEPLDVVVPPGSKLVLMIHQGSYGDHIQSVPTYPMHVHVGGQQSKLYVLTFERGDEAFFLPPGIE